MRVRWVATTPAGAPRPRRAQPRPYLGPPSYPAPPRWGFPHLTWRWPTAVPGTPTGAQAPAQRLRMIARNATTVLWTLAVLATIAAIGEFWRYALLVDSRDSALRPGVVGTSDALVLSFSLLTFVLALFAFAVTLWWLFVARSAAAEDSGLEPPRPAWQVVLGTLVPGPNLVLAGSILAELEHAALRRPADVRPRPSRLVFGWWAAWVGNGVLLALTVVWRMRDGVQADADGVVLSGLTDLAAATVAGLTALIVRRITRLVAPLDDAEVRMLRVVRVSGAPAVGRRPRPRTAAR
ncbi:DUF4328 domain-containing protein [Prauserella muralis]|uniref:DUF4328 domain-containing protein n=1 Tax=Prauserella muralis TaxID=588067 RepID=UPI001B86E15D